MMLTGRDSIRFFTARGGAAAGAVLALTLLAAVPASTQETPTMMDMPGMSGMMDHGEGVAPSGMMIIPMMKMPMLPGMMGATPKITPWLPGAGIDVSSLPEATPREIVQLRNGDTLDIEAMLVRRTLHNKTFIMYGFNGQYPGPLIRVTQGAEIHVRFTNNIELPTTVHWHGIRLDNRFDGVPDVTQPPVKPGETFWYTIRFPDAGIYWYHPHMREDIQQDMGLYGNLMVDPTDPDYYSPVNREEFLVLDDLLMDGDTLIPYGKENADFAIMGRFGNHLLVNGEPHYHLMARKGEVVRFYITNVANARTYNLSFGDAPIKLVAADVGKFERETMVESIVIAPAQRYIVEVHFGEEGTHHLLNSVQPLDHMLGEFYLAVDTMGMVMVGSELADEDHTSSFATLRENQDVTQDIDAYRAEFDRPPDHELLLTVDIQDLPIIVMHFISIDTTYRAPVEWTDTMSDMNWIATSKEVRWILRDPATGAENMDIDWNFERGTVTKIRLVNDAEAFHPMNHPVHLHGQRFLTITRNGVPVDNLAWRDTELLPVGGTVDILVENSNPGTWMLHCHIAEHLEAGMMMRFEVN